MAEFGDFFTGDTGDGDSAEERLVHEAEELMRQGRFQDAAARYRELRQMSPTDLWVSLGHISALECAGKVGEAENMLEEAAAQHRRNRHVQRFRRMFFERREDPVRVGHARRALAEPASIDDEPVDQLADLYFNQGRYHEAHAELRRLLMEEELDRDEPGLMASINARLGACLRQDGQATEARRHLLAALDLDGDNHWTLSELAECERSAGNPEEARRYYLRALATNPEDQWCRGHLAQLEHEQGNSEEAVALYDTILEQQPQPTWALVELAQVLTESDPERSRNLALHALQEDPSYPWAYAHLGHLARRDGRLEEARHRFQQALSAAPGSTWILHELADTCRHLGRMEEALTHLEHARNNEPFDPSTYGFLGDTLRGCGRMVESRAHFAKAVELDPHYTWAWRELAEVCAMIGDHQAAQDAYEQACSLEPGVAINDGLMAFLLRCRDDQQSALPFLQRACEQMPDYAWAQRERAEVLLAENRITDAEAATREALHHLPTFGPLRLLLAESMRRQGRRDEALDEIERALEHEPEVPQLWAMRAELLSDRDPALALRYARRAARAADSPEFQLLLAQILRINGRLHEARQLARTISRQQPSAATAWLLLSDLAELRGDLRSARVAADLGLRHSPEDWRLRLRLQRLRYMAGDHAAADDVADFFTAPSALVPWREAALFLAQAGRHSDCQRALAELLRHSQSFPAAQSDAWRACSECEVHLGNHQAALTAIDRAIDCDPDAAANHLLAAALREQFGQGEVAISHLETLHARIAKDADLGPDQRFILRQLAAAYTRQHRHQEAIALYERLARNKPHDLEIAADISACLRADGQAAAARDHLAAIIAQQSPEALVGDHGQRLLHESCLAAMDLGGPLAGAEHLLQFRAFCRGSTHELLAQLLLVSGRHEEALRAADDAHAQAPAERQRAAQIIRLRCLIALGKRSEATVLAAALVAEDSSDEIAAVLCAELAAYAGEHQRALSTLLNPSLPENAHLERILLVAVLHLELGSIADCMTWLGQHTQTLNTMAGVPPLLRVLRHAWPSIPGRQPCPAVSSDDLGAFPPLCTAGICCAQALSQNGYHDLAAVLLSNLASAVERRLGRGHGRGLWRQAAYHWCRARGQRRHAWRAAWRARSPLPLFRCCIP